VLAAMTLLPAVLGLLGDRINWLTLPFIGHRGQPEGTAASGTGSPGRSRPGRRSASSLPADCSSPRRSPSWTSTSDR
jgi:uncharacterized membrane protein YdfJ with MMPL/SSD domain